MIHLDSQIRLTRREVERFRKITGIEPVDIRTLVDLENYIAHCKAQSILVLLNPTTERPALNG